MESITSFLAGLSLGLGIWTWLFIGIELIILGVCCAKEFGVGALVSLAILAVPLYFLEHINLFAYIIHHPIQVALGCAGYFIAGTVWSMWKWKRLVQEGRKRFERAKNDFIGNLLRRLKNSNPEGTDSNTVIREDAKNGSPKKEAWKQQLERGDIPDDFIDLWKESSRFERWIIAPSEHKDTIFSWIIMWPLSLLGYLLSDILRDLAEWCYNRFKWIYARISHRAFKDVDPRLIGKAE